jgi:predicted nucleic acid-binding protein
VIVILDASTLINLANGEVFAAIASLPGRSFKVSEVVRQESKTVARAIQIAIKRGDMAWVDADLIDAGEYEDALDSWGLGPGETECILAARVLGCSVACDDGAARRVIKKNMDIQLTGSIGLLRDAVRAGLLTGPEAYDAFELMKRRGGYLPDLQTNDF